MTSGPIPPSPRALVTQSCAGHDCDPGVGGSGELPESSQPAAVDIAPGTTLAARATTACSCRTWSPSRGQDLRIYPTSTTTSSTAQSSLGNPTATGGYEDLLPNGQYRAGLSGDGTSGGSFETGYIVVPNGNVIYVRPDYVDEPLLTADDPERQASRSPLQHAGPRRGSEERLRPEQRRELPQRFQPEFDSTATAQFDRSALVAAEQLSLRRNRADRYRRAAGHQADRRQLGQVTQASYVIQAPSGAGDPIANDASITVPKFTSLVFDAGATVKLFNATIFVQNQGSSLQVKGDANDLVTFTS